MTNQGMPYDYYSKIADRLTSIIEREDALENSQDYDTALQIFIACSHVEINNLEIALSGTGYDFNHDLNTVCVFRLHEGNRIAYYFDCSLFYRYFWPLPGTSEQVYHTLRQYGHSLYPRDSYDESITSLDIDKCTQAFTSNQALGFLVLIMKNTTWVVG
jgi:hypothetical protein